MARTPPTPSSIGLQHAARCGLAAFALAAFAASAGAQSSSHAPHKATHHMALALGHIVGQQTLADAVLSQTLQGMWDAADPHFHEGEYNHFINLARIIVQGNPHDMERYTDASYYLWSQDRSDEAVTMLKQGAQKNPNSWYMWDALGSYYYAQARDPKDAIPYLQKAVALKPPSFGAINALANCYERTGQWEKAVKTWEQATYYPNDLLAIQRLRRARAKLAAQ